MLEYRRDVGRFLRGESAVYPNIPQGYFDTDTVTALKEIEDKEKLVESSLLGSDVIDSGSKELLKVFDPAFKDKILEAILSQIANNPQLKDKFVKELVK
jgi:DNA topoisomerase IA